MGPLFAGQIHGHPSIPVTYYPQTRGGVAEWFKAAVLKTAVLKGTVGSNPTPSAIKAGGTLTS